jgi:phosphatidylserine synthase
VLDGIDGRVARLTNTSTHWPAWADSHWPLLLR